MPTINGRYRTSFGARKVYTTFILAATAVWACISVYQSFTDQPEISMAIGSPEFADGAQRRLLSSGVEIIPGFTGAKCGNYWYATPTYGPDAGHDAKYKKKTWSSWNANTYFADPTPAPTATSSPTSPTNAPTASPTTSPAPTGAPTTGAPTTGAPTDSPTTSPAPTGSPTPTSSPTNAVWFPYNSSDAPVEAYAAWEASSGGIVYVIASIYLFLGVAIICDNQFTDSLEMICSPYGLHLPPDVAGATFMAAGSSAPELATSFLGVFVAKSAVGLGTILGSAVFNILIIIGAVAILSSEPLELDYRPVVRDNFFYGVSVILLCVLLAVDDQANLVDTIVLLIWYLAYVVFLGYNDFCMSVIFGDKEKEEKKFEVVIPGENRDIDSPMTPTMGTDPTFEPVDIITAQQSASVVEEPVSAEGTGTEATPATGTGVGSGRGPETEPVVADEPTGAADTPADSGTVDVELEGSDEHKKSSKRPSYSSGQLRHIGTAAEDEKKEEEDEEEEEKGPCEKCVDMTMMVLSFPYEIIFQFTMPDCHLEEDDDPTQQDGWEESYEAAGKEERKKMIAEVSEGLTCGQKWYWATFFISLIHITWISYFMVEFMLKIGCLWGIPDVVMGLTFLAMGTSIPDALGSISVAEDGEGDMAVSNAVGSNVFDICMGLGLPWFIKLAMEANDHCNYIPIWEASKDVIPSIIILLTIIVVLFAVFVLGEWVLYPKSGYALFAAYGLFIVYQLLNTYVFNPDPSECGDPCC